MNQINKFYISSFLKNQSYFTPIMILFLQFYHLSYSEIFWVYTIAAAANVILEIPTGILGDIIGRKKTMIASRIFTFAAFIIYGFSGNFVPFVIAQVMISIGESLRSGTDVAYIYDYLSEKAPNVNYTEVKGKQKFWARISEAIATAMGASIAAFVSFNAVFLAASIPAFINIILTIRFEDIKEPKYSGRLIDNSVDVTKKSIIDLFTNKMLLRIVLNITFFVAIVTAADKFIQPYMKTVGVPVELFGIVYAASFILTAIAVRYSYIFEKKFSKNAIIDLLTVFSVIPLFIIGMGYVSVFGIVLFFMLIIAMNIRSPIENHSFQENVLAKRRATMGSILMMCRNIGTAIILPIIGFFTEQYDYKVSMLLLSVLMLIVFLAFRLSAIQKVLKHA